VTRRSRQKRRNGSFGGGSYSLWRRAEASYSNSGTLKDITGTERPGLNLSHSSPLVTVADR
jgi:hypothetical protein